MGAATVIDVLFTAQSLETGLTLTLLFAPAKETLFDALAIFTTAAYESEILKLNSGYSGPHTDTHPLLLLVLVRRKSLLL